MKKRMTEKRMLALILSLVMVVGITCHVSALEPSPSAAPAPESSANDGTGDGTTNQEKLDELGLEEEDFFITDEVARYIAEFFIRDMKATGNTIWDDNTSIVEIVPMYDETGENIVAYSAELTEGYITISAYIDMPSLILEWADEATPIYEEMKQEAPVAYSADSSGPKIVYLGGLDYLLDDGDDILETVDGIEVFRSELSEGLSEYRDVDNVKEEAIDNLIQAKEEAAVDNLIVPYAGENTPGGYISNVFTYAKNVYGGTWKSYSWQNEWQDAEKSITSYSGYKFAVTGDFPGKPGVCGPTAITNIIRMYGHQYNDYLTKYSPTQWIFDQVMAANDASGCEYYPAEGGTPPETTGDFIIDSFRNCGITVSTYGYYDANIYNIKNATTANRLMYLILPYESGAPYWNHAVVGYAYNVICEEAQPARPTKSFLKIADGHNKTGRYLAIDSKLATYEYLEVYFS